MFFWKSRIGDNKTSIKGVIPRKDDLESRIEPRKSRIEQQKPRIEQQKPLPKGSGQ